MVGIDLENLKEDSVVYIKTQHYISNDLFNEKDVYVVDTETYNLNSKIRMIQLSIPAKSQVIIFLHGDIVDEHKIQEDPNLKAISIDIRLFTTEKEMVESFFEHIINNPKPILGHNVAHFDLGILQMKKTKYKIQGIHFFAYPVGSGLGARRLAFTYVVTNEPIEKNWYNDHNLKRYLIIDTLAISFTLNIKSSLKDLSHSINSDFPKKDVDYRLFEKKSLPYEAVVYGIFDVLSVPDVLAYLQGLYREPTKKYMKILAIRSQEVADHVWMKGSGSLAEAVLNKLMEGSERMPPDYLTKYFGGFTRSLSTTAHRADSNRSMRYLDLTSAYPFSMLSQSILDILFGEYDSYNQCPFSSIKDLYDKMIYSSTFIVKARNNCKVYIEGERHKKNSQFGIGFFRSFNHDQRIQNMMHQLIAVRMLRGEEIILTKTEYEITRALLPDDFRNLRIIKVVDALIPTDSAKSRSFMKLYEVRRDLKSAGNPANVGYKIVINSIYGKIAESKGKWFHLGCASAITGFVRVQLIKLIAYAESIGATVLYSDTDSMYVKANPTQTKKIITYSNTLNSLPLEYGEDNLKDEGEDIVAFWANKRKNYLKVLQDE